MRALIFMPALAGAVVFGFVFLLFASHYYLTVLESTASGGKDVTWVSEPITDNFGRFWYMLFLVVLWLGPAYIIGRAATAGTDAAWLKLAVPLLVFGVCFPVGQLSSLSASTPWMPLAPDVFVRLAQKPAVVAGFAALSAATLAVFGVAFTWTFLTADDWTLLFVGAPLLVVAGLVYARLIGRLAFALRFTKGLFREKKNKKPKPPPVPAPRTDDEPEAGFSQPSDLPPVTTPGDGELTGYDVLIADDPPPRPKKRVKAEVEEPEPAKPTPPVARPRRPAPESAVERGRVWTDEDDEAPTAYGVREPEVKAEDRIPAEVVTPREDEMKLLSRDDVPKKPKRVWGPELLSFLGQPGTVSAVVIASGLCFVVGVMVRVARANNPVAGG